MSDHEHDWRIDPSILLMSDPPQQKLVCTGCPEIRYRVAYGAKNFTSDKESWPKA